MTEIDAKYLVTCLLFDMVSAFVINAFFGLFATPVVPVIGTAVGRNWISPENIIMDIFFISLYSGFFIGIFVTFGVREDIKKGKVQNHKLKRDSIPILKYLPDHMLLRSLIFAGVSLLIFFPIGYSAITLLQIESLPYWNFIIMKGLFGIIVSSPMTVITRICALGD